MNVGLLGRVEAPFATWQRSLVFEPKRYGRAANPGTSEKDRIHRCQEQLEAAVFGGPQPAAEYLRGVLELRPGEEIRGPGFTRSMLTPGEYQNPPILLEQELGKLWAKQISPRLASRPCFWLLCHIDWIERGTLGTGDLRPYLMAGSGELSPEQKARNFLRRTGGIYVRGKVSVYSDCTLARAFWRNRLAQEVSRTTESRMSASDAHRALHRSRPAWERLILVSLRRLTVINHPHARAAIVAELSKRLGREDRISEKQVKRMALTIARLGLRYSLEHLPRAVLAQAVSESTPEVVE